MTTTSEPLQVGVRPGEVLAGKYRVERVLGAGGMGVVVAAHHLQLDRKVAIKLLLPGMLHNPDVVSRFAREAKAAVKITSEHVARVIDVGTLDTGAPYIVMEYLEGGDLAAWLEQRGPLPIEQAVEFVLHACVAVAEAHGLGIVHRDLKPANLFCVRRSDGQLSVKVLDFGISKLTDAGGSSNAPGMSTTKTSAIMGSPLYMSPEQMQSSKGADAQSDIWALGIILYELLAGRVPFYGEVATEVAIKVAMEPPAPLRGFRPDVTPGLEAVILKCLEKDRRHRFRNVAQLALALAEFAPKRARASIDRVIGTIQAAGLSVSALEMPPSPQTTETVLSAGTIAPIGQTTPVPGGAPRRGVVAGVALAGVLAVCVGAAVLLRDRGTTRTVPTSFASGPAPSLTMPRSLESVAAPTPLPNDAVVLVPILEAGAPTHSPLSTLPPSRPSPRPSPPPPASPPSQTPVASRSCDPPFTLDDQGRKHFKPECYLKN